MKNILIKLIKSYQKHISPDHSDWAKKANRAPYCRYYPSCSQYMIESLEKKGLIIGLFKGTWRIIKCNPWSKGGYDPVEKKK